MEKSDFKNYILESNPLLRMIISGHLMIEKYLTYLLATSIPKPEVLLKGNGPSFSVLVNINEACGFIESDLAKVLRIFNTIRNKYVHHLSYVGAEDHIKPFIEALKNMNESFFISTVPANEKELAFAMSSLLGWFENKYGKLLTKT